MPSPARMMGGDSLDLLPGPERFIGVLRGVREGVFKGFGLRIEVGKVRYFSYTNYFCVRNVHE